MRIIVFFIESGVKFFLQRIHRLACVIPELGFPDRLSDFNKDDALDAEDLESLVNWMTGPVE